MTETDEPQYRAYHRAASDRVELREEDDEDGVFRVRMPIATTGDVRNEGDDPLSRDELEGMATQIDERAISVFADHGRNPDLAGSRYSSIEALGEWEDPAVQAREADDEEELLATARLMDPSTMDEATGMLREGLARLKAQVDRDMSLSSSIGWRDDDGYPGGVDLMETSIVGIGADPRTTSQDAPLAQAQARAAVMGSTEERHLSEQQAAMAGQVLDAYRNEQGNGSVDNFESWLWSARDQFDANEIHATRTALQEFYRETTPLEEPVTEAFVPFLDERDDGDGDANTNDMTENDSADAGGDDDVDPDGTHDDGSDGMDDSEYRESMLEMQRTQTEALQTITESLREDDEDDDEDDDEGDEDEDEEDDGGENGADVDGEGDERTVTIDGEERAVDEALADLREQVDAADAAEAQTNDRSESGDETTDDDSAGFGFAGAGGN